MTVASVEERVAELERQVADLQSKLSQLTTTPSTIATPRNITALFIKPVITSTNYTKFVEGYRCPEKLQVVGCEPYQYETGFLKFENIHNLSYVTENLDLLHAGIVRGDDKIGTGTAITEIIYRCPNGLLAFGECNLTFDHPAENGHVYVSGRIMGTDIEIKANLVPASGDISVFANSITMIPLGFKINVMRLNMS